MKRRCHQAAPLHASLRLSFDSNTTYLEKTTMKRPLFFGITAALTIGWASAQAADMSAGKTMFADACAQCHGPTGKGMASFPSLRGRDTDYIESRLKQYRAGERVGANSSLMIPNAANLSDDDIANLAAYIAENFD
ncbi:c-type cytochrome [Marinobacter changyiensis]|uniref:c-type cytochrome n=1 Tax=Marinobacter changyiensis TaxID=2604091 RepID=UPI001C555B02|nr:cytochrome c [Marinobacter changyiensis]